jgi:pyrimidine-nucleoside phosphorylase
VKAPTVKAPAGKAPLAMPSLIARKRDGGELADADLRAVIAGAAAGDIPEYQLSALLMAIVWRGMTTRELVTWTLAMIDSGQRLRWPGLRGPKVDKHSTGGVGDKISLALAPVVAACGVYVPMMAGRALGHTGGTLDKLETIPGFRTRLDPTAFGRVLARAGFVLAGQSATLAPADRVLYALRDATATVESIPLIASSILSKKVAEGADGLVMDVKVGSGAFLPELAQARELARTLIALGRRLGLTVRALLTDMDQPLGEAVGNALEVREVIDVLRGAGPPDVRALTVRLGAEMLVLGGVARDRRAGERAIEAALSSGAGLERLRLGIRLQGGDPRVLDDPDRLPRARHTRTIRTARPGVVARVDAGAIGRAATLLGAGRLRKEDRIAPGAGILVHAKPGQRLDRGDALCTLAFDDPARARAVRPLLAEAFQIQDPRRRVTPRPLVLETLA